MLSLVRVNYYLGSFAQLKYTHAAFYKSTGLVACTYLCHDFSKFASDAWFTFISIAANSDPS